jgi:hypothetical protein
MAISIDWGTKVIFVPQADLTFVSGTLYSLDVDQFRKDLNALQYSFEGMPNPTTHLHNTEVTIAGVTYARQVIITNGYTVTFEDGQYAVRLEGANNNIFDEGIINRNQVSIIPTNSSGLTIVETGVSGLTPAESAKLLGLDAETAGAVWDMLASAGTATPDSMGELVEKVRKLAALIPGGL